MSTGTLHAVAVACAVAMAASAAAMTPQDTVRAFCRRDGLGDRLRARTWPNVAPLIAWEVEPGWDRVSLIDGYEVGDARFDSDGMATVEVTYFVAAEIRAGAVVRDAREETYTFRLELDESAAWWRILAPPPPPHVFASQVESDTMAASLAVETGDFLTASSFVWQFLDGAGWDVALFATAEVAATAELVEVDTPRVGDIVVYYDGERPYHIGLLEEEAVVLSATLNGGIRRTSLDAFAGTVRYRRVRPGARKPTPAPIASGSTRSPRRRPTAGMTRETGD